MQRVLRTEILYCNVQTPSTAEAVPLPQIAACAADGGKSDKTPGGLRLPVGYSIVVSPGSQGEFRGAYLPPFVRYADISPAGGIFPLIFRLARRKTVSNPFFPGARTSEKTLLSLQVCERPPQASARSRLHPPRFVEMP